MSMIQYFLRVTNNELESIIENSTLLEEAIDSEPNGKLLDIDKSWEGIFFILSGCRLANFNDAQPPIKWAIFGDAIIDEDQDFGYGPAEYRTSKQVKAIAEALENFSDERFKEVITKTDANITSEIYPFVIWSEDDEIQEYFLDNFIQLKEFYSEASKNNEAVISFTS